MAVQALGRTLAVAYLSLALVGGLLLFETSRNYIDVTDSALRLPEGTFVSGVAIHWSGLPEDRPLVKVYVDVTNPGRLAIEVLALDFDLHMDDPAPGFQSDQLDQTFIRPGGFSHGVGFGFVIPAGETRTLNATVPIDPLQMSRFDRPDTEGRYHPVVWFTSLIYSFVDLPDVDRQKFFFAPYYEALGVVPIG